MGSVVFKETNYSLRILAVIFVLVTLLSPAFAILQNGNIKIFAVTDDHKGMAADLFMYAISGTGKAAFVTSNSLVGKDTQTTGNIALKIAQQKTNSLITNNDIMFDIRANATEVDGPSAGAAMTLLAYSMLSEKPLSNEVAVTGTINSDGSIGMVGGVGPKAQVAAKSGIKLFMIPSGEAVADITENGIYQTVNLLEYGPVNLEMKIVEVSYIDQAIQYAYSNIDEIIIDYNSTGQIFIPEPIQYDLSLEPMTKISQGYVLSANSVVNETKKMLEQSSLSEKKLADLYQRYSSTKRGVEMSKRFLDQNYLYSAANYAFNAKVLAGTIKEVAENPALLSEDTTILNSKITLLEEELSLAKQRTNFIPIDGFEWIVGAQQRIAYAENALNKIKASIIAQTNDSDASNSGIIPNDTEQTNVPVDIIDEVLLQRVYDYVSAKAWLSVSKDFLSQAQKYPEKKIPYYSKDFIDMVNNNISKSDLLIKDSNVSIESIVESMRRLDSAKISRDNNFLFAALYDAYFAESFIQAEIERSKFSSSELFDSVSKSIEDGSKSDSVWANMFFDHAKFYYQNALFNKKLERSLEVDQSLYTSFDLIYLSSNLSKAKSIVDEYVAFADLKNFVANEPIIDIKYNNTKIQTNFSNVLLLAGVLFILLFVLAMVLFSVYKSRKSKNVLHYSLRYTKLKGLLFNLDKALLKKKISQGEYFLLRKKYEHEISHVPNIKEDRKQFNLSLDDLKAKLSALENGLRDQRRHYKEGLILTEDYLRNYQQVSDEIKEVKLEIEQAHKEFVLEKEIAKQNQSKVYEPVKGTQELAEEEEDEEREERTKRKKFLRRYAYKSDK